MVVLKCQLMPRLYDDVSFSPDEERWFTNWLHRYYVLWFVSFHFFSDKPLIRVTCLITVFLGRKIRIRFHFFAILFFSAGNDDSIKRTTRITVLMTCISLIKPTIIVINPDNHCFPFLLETFFFNWIAEFHWLKLIFILHILI